MASLSFLEMAKLKRSEMVCGTFVMQNPLPVLQIQMYSLRSQLSRVFGLVKVKLGKI
jgi:hypothetical protein